MRKIYPYLLLCSISSVAFSDSTEMLQNPQFTDGLEPWTFVHGAEYRGKVQPPVVAPAGGARKIPECMVNVPHSSSWHYIRINQPVELVNGQTYRVFLEAKYREAPGDLHIATWSSGIQKNNGLSQALTMKSHWQRYEVKFRARNVDDSEVPLFLCGFGNVKGNVAVRNFSMEAISDDSVKANLLKVIELEGEASRPAITTVPADVQQMINDFSEDINGAKRKYAGRNLALSAAVTGVEKGPRPGSYILALLDGGVKITVGGAAFDEAAYTRLNGTIRKTRSEIRDDQKDKKALWEKLDRDATAQKEYGYYPVVDCIARIHNYRNRTIEIQQTMDLSIGYPSR
jgi:hypothetical protein